MNETQMMIEQYKEIHSKKRYGTTACRTLKYYEDFIKALKPQSALDYGCGQGGLLNHLKYIPKRVQYDPAIPEYDTLPEGTFDLVICSDVLEHIPESGLNDVLAKIAEYSKNAVIAVSVIKAFEILPNGQNAHCTVKPKEWWSDLLNKYFDKVDFVFETGKSGKVIFKTF